MRIGLQISSLKPYIQTREGVRDTFRRVREMGYTDIQLQWTGEDIPCEFIAGEMRENGFNCWGTQDYYDVVMARMDYEIRAAALYDSHYICLSGIPDRYMSLDGLNAMAAEMRETQSRLSDHGIALTFHPRMREYGLMDGETAVNRLMDMVPGMQLTLDAYHSVLAGIDTPALMRRYSGRIDMLHLKNASALDPKAPLVPVGAGAIDFSSIAAACPAAGVKLLLAEQETWQRDAFDCMAESLEYLKSIVGAE